MRVAGEGRGWGRGQGGGGELGIQQFCTSTQSSHGPHEGSVSVVSQVRCGFRDPTLSSAYVGTCNTDSHRDQTSPRASHHKSILSQEYSQTTDSSSLSLKKKKWTKVEK